ncbi:MAG: hypothetical protein C5B50_25155 [Verrucomicrobia bacterium]|nr:MAG: hypothetical protein C5B50_25155 [Verrucomicrobiota bacterium]
MNSDEKRTLSEALRRNPFWICLIVFSLLAVERGVTLMRMLDVRQQLEQATLAQARKQGAVYQTQQLDSRVNAFGFELIQMGRTNATAQKIVQDLGIQWSGPGPAGAAPGMKEGKQ